MGWPCSAWPASRQSTQVVLDRSPFYAEGGGQIGDQRRAASGPKGRLVVEDTQRVGDAIVHVGRLEGQLEAGEPVEARVDEQRRWAAARNHTATHLLHRALRDVLGEQAKQAGSWVGPGGPALRLPGVGGHAACAAARGRAPRERADPAQRGGRADLDVPGRGAGDRRRHVLRREVRAGERARGAGRRIQRASCAAARTWRPPGRSARSGSPASRASAPACGASRR